MMCAWVILPNIIKTDFEKGKGWDLEGKLIKKLPEWKWEDHGVTPVVQAVSLEDGGGVCCHAGCRSA